MFAKGVTTAEGSVPAAKASVSNGDVVWLNAMRNSPVSLTPLYQRMQKQVRAASNGH